MAARTAVEYPRDLAASLQQDMRESLIAAVLQWAHAEAALADVPPRLQALVDRLERLDRQDRTPTIEPRRGIGNRGIKNNEKQELPRTKR